MHRNTALTISFLAIIAALLIGLNIGRKLSGENLQASPLLATNPSPQITEILASPSASNASNSANVAGTSSKNYIHHGCGISFDYPADYKIIEASNAARLINPKDQTNIDLICETTMTPPPVAPEKSETASVAGQIVTIYHDQQVSSSSLVDVVMLKNTRMGLDIAIMGYGEIFNQILKTIKIL